MAKFQVEIEEILQRVEEVEAKDLEEALDIIEEKYNSQEIVLGAEDFKEHEIREYVDKVRIQDLKKDAIFNIKSGKAILLEGNEKKALIKKIGVKEYPYVVVTGLTVNKYQTYFEWNQGTYFQNISEADERFIQMAGYDQIQNDINYSKVGEWTLGSYNIERFDSIDEVFAFFMDKEDINKEKLIEMLSEKVKREIVFNCADVLVEENGKFYYGEDLYFFEEDINNKVRKIDNILNELNITNVKPYDVIELIEQNNLKYKDENLINRINDSIKAAGYDKDIKDFINYMNEEIYKECEEIKNEEIIEEDEM